MILYYSACGNSKFVAKSLATKLGDELKFIPTLVDNGDYNLECDNKALGFVFPVYGWDVPRIVYEYVEKMNLKGKPSYVWFACTCGDNIGTTCQKFRKALMQKELSLDAAYTFQMPETYLCFPGFKLDTKEGVERKISAVRAKLPLVAEQILQKQKIEDLIPGGLPRFKTSVIGPLFNMMLSDSAFYSNDDCISCGVCEHVCPFHNIEMIAGENGKLKPHWKGSCTQCMACYHYCPKNAIHYGKLTQGKGQYHFHE